VFQLTVLIWTLFWWWKCDNIALSWISWSNWWEWIQLPVYNRSHSLNNVLIKIIFLQLGRTLIEITFSPLLTYLGGWGGVEKGGEIKFFLSMLVKHAHATCSTQQYGWRHCQGPNLDSKPEPSVIWQHWLVFPRLAHVSFPALVAGYTFLLLICNDCLFWLSVYNT